MSFVLSLVTANILISSIIAPLLLFETILYEYLLLPCISDVISTVSSCVIFSAVFSTLLIATDRFYAVTSPLHYSMTITRSRSQVMIVLAWLSGLVLALPYTLLCTLSHHTHLQKNLHIMFVIMQASIGYLIPFIGLCWLYLRMYHAAHRNSERTRKHSISGELLTVMDGSTSVIPQGIDFLTHYMNPFTRNPMAGSVQPVGNGHHQDRNSIGQVVPVVVKKTRRRSSNGSSSSLLFREEGRAIKTAFFVLASFFVCWTPHFAFMLVNEISSEGESLGHYYVYDNVTVVEIDSSLPKIGTRGQSAFESEHPSSSSSSSSTSSPSSASFYSSTYGSEWAKFLGVLGMLLSSVLNPFIYVFRNKMASEEILRLVYGLVGKKHLSNEDQHNHYQQQREKESRKSLDSGSGVAHPAINDTSNLYDNDELPVDVPDYQPRYTPCIGKSPKRSSMKSLTPQSSINSTMTNCNSMTGAPVDSASPTVTRDNEECSHTSFSNGRPPKPPFMRSLTLPEQTQPRVKFPANLTRQKSYAYRASSTKPNNAMATPAVPPSFNAKDISSVAFKRAKFVRQDSICSILSNDSVLMICSEDGMSVAEVGPLGILNLAIPSQVGNGTPARINSTIPRVPEKEGEEETSPQKQHPVSSSIQGTPISKCYLRQDSNFSDVSNRTNDSGIGLSSICSATKRIESSGTGGHPVSPESCRHHDRQVCPRKISTSNQVQHAQHDACNGHFGHRNTHSHSHHHHQQQFQQEDTNSQKIQSPVVSTALPAHHDSNYHQLNHHSPILLQTSI
ncbi:unnamed protein product [Orchesella dallaii]|uniref:G-protein coupled receptors family 1 profile domain-containing protein n=1 Tax=Orchesella dallaii TaxID=48710 RepID=A0ABP1RCC7_9HEXA